MTKISEWWPKLPEHIRDAIRTNPSGALSAESVAAITQARGAGPTAAQWVNLGTPDDHRLTSDESQWIERNA